MPTYRVKDGVRHGAGGIYDSGTILEYSEYEASGFIDKLELMGMEFETPAENEYESRINYSFEGLSVTASLKAVDDGLISASAGLEQAQAEEPQRKTLLAGLAKRVADE